MRLRDVLGREFGGFGLIALVILLGVLTLAGGASRADAFAQVISRSAAFAALVAALIFTDRGPDRSAVPLLVLLAAAVAIPLIQLIPLPPDLWAGLPGRDVIREAGRVAGGAQPWRPISLVPGATINAASSLVVPVSVALLAIQLNSPEQYRLMVVMLILIAASALIGLLQATGAGFDNPLLNDSPGDVSGLFANRNHFASLMAIGLVLAPVWAVQSRSGGHVRPLVAFGLIILFVLIILAGGSRAGMVLGLVGLALGLLIVRGEIGRSLSFRPRWLRAALLGGLVMAIAMSVLISISADRAVSIERALDLDVSRDARSQALPVILKMITAHFPVGTGFGTFDQAFRIYEPFQMLRRTYLNQAHNDYAQIVLEGGLAGAVLLVAALSWWGSASFRAWRAAEPRLLAKAGSVIIFLVLLSSAFDYPARTPMVMAVVVIAAAWVAKGSGDGPRALRSGTKTL